MSAEIDYLRQLLLAFADEDTTQQVLLSSSSDALQGAAVDELLARALTASERLPVPVEGSLFTRLYRDCHTLLEHGAMVIHAKSALTEARRDWDEQRQILIAQLTREFDAENRRFCDDLPGQ